MSTKERFAAQSAGAFSRRDFLKLGAGVGAASLTAGLPSLAGASEPRVLNYLAWPGNADPFVVAEFEKANNAKIRNISLAHIFCHQRKGEVHKIK